MVFTKEEPKLSVLSIEFKLSKFGTSSAPEDFQKYFKKISLHPAKIRHNDSALNTIKSTIPLSTVFYWDCLTDSLDSEEDFVWDENVSDIFNTSEYKKQKSVLLASSLHTFLWTLKMISSAMKKLTVSLNRGNRKAKTLRSMWNHKARLLLHSLIDTQRDNLTAFS